MTEVKTPSGYLCTIKDEITYGEYLELQKALTKNLEFDLTTQAVKNLGADVIYDQNKRAIELLVKKILKPDGSVVTDILLTVMDMPKKDGEFLVAELNKITQENALPKKKGIS